MRYTVIALAALAGALISALGAAPANDAMPATQQNALVQKYCAVCHTDAHMDGGLSLEHFDAVSPDPGVAAMMLSKLKTGAIGASGVPRPDRGTVEAWMSALLAESAGANRWTVNRTEDPATKIPVLIASVVQELPSATGGDVPDSYRLTLTCSGDAREAEMRLAWAPGVPESGRVISALVDSKEQTTYTVDGMETMGNGSKGTSGPGSIVLHSRKGSETQKAAMPLPERTLAISNLFAHETVVFPFGELEPGVRKTLSTCFTR